MIKFLIPFIFLTANVFAALPPASSKGSGEASYSTTFKTNYGSIPVTRSGTTVTLGTPPLATTVTTIPALSGEVSNTGNAVTLDNSSVLGKVLTGFTSGAGTVTGTDSLLQAIQKLNGNDALDKTVSTKSQSGTAVSTSQIQTPYNQLTTTATGERLIETGNANVLADPGAEATSTPWSAYKNAAGVLPVDGTGGTASYITCANDATAPLAGTKSFLITKISANNAQGEGCSIPFTIPTSSTYKVNRLSFDYAIASGTYDNDEIEWFVYDVTNATLKPFTPSKLKNHTLPSETFEPNGVFQTSNSTSYRLIAHVASTSSASAWALKFDNFKLGVYENTYGSAVTDWVSYTPTGTWASPSTVSYLGKYRTKGDSIEVMIRSVVAAAPTGSYNVTIPTGLSIDVSKLANGAITNLESIGSAMVYDASTGIRYSGNVSLNNTTSVRITTHASSSDITATNPITFAVGDVIETSFSVPIAGWSSSQIMSNDADTRVVAARVSRNASQSIPNNTYTKVLFDNVSFDNTSTYSAVNNRMIARVSGTYTVDASILFGGNATGLRIINIYKNGALYSESRVQGSNLDISLNISDTVNMLPADYLEIFAFQNSGGALNIIGGSGYNYFSLKRISGPSQIAASESVSASYWLSANFAASATVPINFDSKEFDSHNSVTASPTAWKFTAPSPGEYSINAELPLAVAGGGYLKLYKGGVNYKQAGYVLNTAGTGKAIVKVKLLQGEYIDLRPDSSLTFAGGPLNSSSSNITITRTGNY